MKVKTSVLEDFSCRVLHTVVDPEIKSSTYGSLRILATSSGSFFSQWLRCISITPPSRKGDDASPNRALVNLRDSSGDCSSRRQWKRIASRSVSFTLTCRSTFCKSPVMATGLKRPVTSTLQSLSCRDGPVWKQSFTDGYFSSYPGNFAWVTFSLLICYQHGKPVVVLNTLIRHSTCGREN